MVQQQCDTCGRWLDKNISNFKKYSKKTNGLNEERIYTNISIDQIQPQLGYTKDNIQLVCMAVNQLKSDFSMQEVLTVCNAVVNNAAKWNK